MLNIYPAVIQCLTRNYCSKLIVKESSYFRASRRCIVMSSSHSMDLSDMRVAYNADGSDRFDVTSLITREPFGNFRHWFEMARQCSSIIEPNAMFLATANKSGMPSVRTVLLKGFDENGFKFFTNYNSRKGQELADNPRASLLFYWEPLHKQVRIEGSVIRLSEEESTEYFHSRPRASQMGAIISDQSQPIESRQILDERLALLTAQYSDETRLLPKPQHWGGFLLQAERVEFWQGNANRLHDRILFRRRDTNSGDKLNPALTCEGTDGWFYERLAP